MRLTIKVAMALLPLATLAAPATWAQNSAGVALQLRTTVPPPPARPSAALPAAWQESTPPPPWAAQDPADSLYRAGREALNQGDNSRAVGIFQSLASRFPTSAYAPDAHYWEAFARYRIGGAEQFRLALAALERQRTRHPNAATRADAQALATRIQGELARLGDGEAAQAVTQVAEVVARGTRDGEAGSASAAGECAREESEIRTAALNALLQLDAERALPVLRQVLARRDPCSAPLRRQAVFLIAQKASAETEAMLLEIARKDPDPEVRRSAVFYLSQVKTDRAVAALEEILRTPADSTLHERALFALSQHSSERASRTLRAYAERTDVPEVHRERAIFWIGQDRASDNSAFLQSLYRRSASDRLKDRILFSLSQTPDGGNGPWLLAVARDTSESIRMRKSALFRASQARVPIQELLDLYRQMPDAEMKDQLLFVYSQREEAAAVDRLIEIAQKEPNLSLRKKAIFWLSQSKDPRVAQVLLELIGGT